MAGERIKTRMKTKNNIANIEQFQHICCGCGACEEACPVHAITMQLDSEGFLYPCVSDACISCGKCKRVCQLYERPPQAQKGRHLVWCYTKDEDIRKGSSSGGFFWEVASKILASGGAVYGAATDSDLSVSHRCAENERELGALTRSKYVQSRLQGCFSEIGTRLEKGQTVLFVGTPCQVAAAKTFLGETRVG